MFSAMCKTKNYATIVHVPPTKSEQSNRIKKQKEKKAKSKKNLAASSQSEVTEPMIEIDILDQSEKGIDVTMQEDPIEKPTNDDTCQKQPQSVIEQLNQETLSNSICKEPNN